MCLQNQVLLLIVVVFKFFSPCISLYFTNLNSGWICLFFFSRRNAHTLIPHIVAWFFMVRNKFTASLRMNFLGIFSMYDTMLSGYISNVPQCKIVHNHWSHLTGFHKRLPFSCWFSHIHYIALQVSMTKQDIVITLISAQCRVHITPVCF